MLEEIKKYQQAKQEAVIKNPLITNFFTGLVKQEAEKSAKDLPLTPLIANAFGNDLKKIINIDIQTETDLDASDEFLEQYAEGADQDFDVQKAATNEVKMDTDRYPCFIFY